MSRASPGASRSSAGGWVRGPPHWDGAHYRPGTARVFPSRRGRRARWRAGRPGQCACRGRSGHRGRPGCGGGRFRGPPPGGNADFGGVKPDEGGRGGRRRSGCARPASLPWPDWTNAEDIVIESARRSAGRTPEQFVDTAAFALGRPARTPVTSSHRDRLLARRRGRTVVDEALGGHRCASPLGDHPDDDHDPFASVLAQPHLITGPDRMRGLDPHPVDPDVPGPASTGRGRAGLGQPHRPDPAVHPSCLITGHSATVMRCADLEPTAESSLRPRVHPGLGAQDLPGSTAL